MSGHRSDGIWEALDVSARNPALSSLVSEWRGRPLVIYGAGPAGRCACDILLRLGERPECMLDARASRLPADHAGIPILPPGQPAFPASWKRDAVVLVCVVQGAEVHEAIARHLADEGFRTVVPWIQKAFSADAIRSSGRVEPRMEDFRGAIMACADLLEDARSRETYLNVMRACALRRFDDLSFLDPQEQYFPSDVEMAKGYRAFMDCGAFRGDTLANLVARVGVPSTYIAFEPDSSNFGDLARAVEDLGVDQAMLFPCAVSHHTGTLRFTPDRVHGGAGSSLDPRGAEMVQSVAIDDCLKGVSPSFIKLDIEGSEVDALAGARRTIERCRPDLAVAVYHYVDHYFEIPNLLHRWGLGYRFHLRTYDRFGNETILYATCRSS
ncbi:FkbM family methyltransferase [Thiorhodococcus minor]|uniref:FkbM family methyltransferase n=1 Tax=Thiorhodococcus minor TaxID=57489 RepID=A0A6M0JTI1_9GAMM|nr:FkbM family methyltransferase [Thiorhodococcus minor]NEV60549.1 FkbM family methyltransferase [Thiorhodococcus minor]